MIYDWPTTVEIGKRLVDRQGLRGFVEHFWRHAEPSTAFVGNWHIDAICDHLEAIKHRWIRDLVITMPPRTGKSLIVDTLFPAYVWSDEPSHKFIAASYDQGLCLRDAGRVVDICQSSDYLALFPGTHLNPNSPLGNLTTKEHGRRFSTTPGSKGTGWGGNTLSCNDPIKPKDAAAKLPTVLQSVREWWTGTMANRRDGNAENFARMVTMQRLAEEDLAGVCLEQGFEHLCLPMRYVPKCQWDRGSTLEFKDPRTEPGELLFPQMWSLAEVNKLEAQMNPRDVAAQNQQNPTHSGGQHLEPEWLERHWTSLPTPAPRRFMQVRQYWDFNSKGLASAGHSRVAGVVVGAFKGKCYLLDWRAGYWNFPTGRKRFEALNELTAEEAYWGWASRIVIEDKANGTPLIDALKDASHPCARKLQRWEPGPLSKEERFMLETDKIAAGLLLFPDPSGQPEGPVPDRPTLEEVKQELLGFPRKLPNDLVDVITMALNDLATAEDVAAGWLAAARQAASWAGEIS